jgi:hypothetical protein
MANQTFIIDDLDKFIENTRVLIFQSFGSETKKDILDTEYDISLLQQEEREELDSVLSQAECILMSKDFIKEQKHKQNKKIRYLVSTNNYMKMIETFNSRMVSNMLNNLVNKGVLETAYDSDSDDFIFWTKNDNQTDSPDKKS